MNSSDNDRKKPDSSDSALDLHRVDTEPVVQKSLSLGQILDIERRLKAGLEIGDEERRQHAEAKASIQRALQGARSAFAEMAEKVRPALAMLPDISRQFFEWQQALSKQLAPVVAQMVEAYQNMPPRIRSALLALGKSGYKKRMRSHGRNN